ncbi:unnamed protein product [Musa hybrid cultivar]
MTSLLQPQIPIQGQGVQTAGKTVAEKATSGIPVSGILPVLSIPEYYYYIWSWSSPWLDKFLLRDSRPGLMIEAEEMFLPPGFRFHPTDEELITHYLAPKVAGTSFCATVIGELDLNKREPWDLPLSTKVGDEWYFFCTKDRKYPTGLRTNRATDSGHWKATGKDKEIHRRRNLIGLKKTLVFYKGRAPKGEKTNWVMHEYRLEGNQSNTVQNAWVICRVFCRRSGEKQDMEWFEDELRSSVPVLSANDHKKNKDGFSSASNSTHVTCFSDGLVGLRGSEELAKPSQNAIMLPLSLSSNATSPATSNLVDLHHRGDSSVQLSESYGRGNDKNLKMEEEALSISEETGLITNMAPDIYTSIRSNFNYQELLPDAERLDVLSWNY